VTHKLKIVAEHNIEIIKNSDWLIELGIGAGKDGGEVIFEGSVKDILNSDKSIITSPTSPEVGLIFKLK